MPEKKDNRLALLSTRMLRYVYLRLLRVDEPPQVIARGFAIGIFIAMLPLIGFQTALGVLVALLLRQSVVPFIVMVWVTNPATVVPVFAFNYQIGKILTPSMAHPRFRFSWPVNWHELFGMGWEFFFTLLVGSVIVGAVSAVAVYFVSLPLIRLLRARKERARMRRKLKNSGHKKI